MNVFEKKIAEQNDAQTPVAPPSRYRPSIYAAPFQKVGDGAAVELLSATDQDALMAISQLVSVRRNAMLYAEGGEAKFVYNVISGVAKTFQLQPNGDRHVTAFLFPRDLLGLSVDGHYVATAQALTPLLAYQIPVKALEAILERDPRLNLGLLCKLCHELRSSQSHAITVSKQHASARLAGFLLWVEHVGAQSGGGKDEFTLPMGRRDMADYLGLTIETVSRALNALEAEGAILRRGPRAIELLDGGKLREAAGLV
ncbi:Crp/Fnr family transcriptional regulator [Paraburkholderia silvatlantica]|uniref:CRP-like cAMP-binding protein n=1 Tax=Paraburkholderia silvatlantica TaxID=321895 RepID=A0A2U0ZG98_9BURK|nr:Crp/Fnr family transcriptional regulator [Paraburkholderia silvatlantica]MBB2930419.1 CRP-like cAMP-binding protein [Paraburkholderia silvatlantica]PVY17904.1 Crp/Fnr family transcriptional regulator [Paraburkholderia silvatlantica]PXW23824.1 Crp/Fnr family transcriptional regulator [Paraburkholderia silvatlantica]PYE12400.1 Crp/Fnr family transcriptional regulator [Paraburkholderia silvatlantica]TDQ73304.1 Crp/Fnr family transcriptional regulator [Paraburkholderia silvatlantica]